MSTPMTLPQMKTAFTKWGVKKFDVFQGAENRGRPGGLTPQGIVDHHTGSDSGQSTDYDNWIFTEGRPKEGIPAPLCNFTIDMDGDLHIGALGRANHAGPGSSSVRNHVINEDYDGYNKELNPGPDDIAGNGDYYGFECKYDGGQPMTAAMYDTLVRANAAICDFYGWSALSVIGHREHTSRKSDPGNVKMWQLRRDIAARLKAGSGTGDLNMADAEEILKLLQTVKTNDDGRYADLKTTITQWAEAHDVERQTALLDKLDALNSNLEMLPKKIATAVVAEVKALLPPQP